MNPGVLVGLDYGTKRIGIAVSTPLGTVHPRPRLDRIALDEDLATLNGIVAEAMAEAIVIGLPHNMDGSVSGMEREVRAFAVQLAEACGVPVYGSDERLTSEAATSAMRQGGVKSRARKGRRDSAAACIVLQDYLSMDGEPERIA